MIYPIYLQGGFENYALYGYLVVAAAVGLTWLYLAVAGCKTVDDRRWAKKLFAFSILAIFVLSLMMSFDFAVPSPPDMLLTYAP